MPFQPGQTGNRAGRPRGLVDKRARDRQAAAKDAPAVLAMLAAKALAGDIDAAKVYLDFTISKPKPEPTRRPIALDTALSIEAQAGQLREALAAGLLSPEEFAAASAGLGQHNVIEQFGPIADAVALLLARGNLEIPPQLRMRIPATINGVRTNGGHK
jgi:Family of unknown function (DUF5681)